MTDEISTIQTLLKEAYQQAQPTISPDKINNDTALPFPSTTAPEEEKGLINAINRYKKLKLEHEKNQYPSLRTKEKLQDYAKKIRKNKNFMRYVCQNHPKIAKNIESLSQSQSVSNEIER